ncbi:AAA family ATPase [Chitinimonas naiadis]
MKISRIQIQNFEGIRRADAFIRTPVAIFAGRNGAGKSSIRDAIAMALTGEPTRIKLKKDYQQLVTEGQKSGVIALYSGNTEVATALLPSGNTMTSLKNEPGFAYLPYALDAAKFASIDADTRRTLLFDITGCKVSADDVRQRLADKGATVDQVEAVLPMLRSGFPAACELATTKAKDAKTAWRVVTGETWGDKKAETWAAPKPSYDAALLEEKRNAIAMFDVQLGKDREELGATKQKLQSLKDGDVRRQHLHTAAKGLPKAEELLVIAQAELAAYLPKVEELRKGAAGIKQPCPPLMHKLAHLVEHAYWNDDSLTKEARTALMAYDTAYRPANGDPDAAAKLPEYEKGLAVLENMAENRALAVKQAKAAAEELAGMEAPDGNIDALERELTQIQACIAEVERCKALAITEKGEAEASKRVADAADEKTKQAASHHADVLSWGLVADALSPDGIPGELVAVSLKPVNDLLMGRSAMAGWELVKIEASMGMTYGGRDYRLLSVSEKWRCDALIAMVIAELSGLKLLVLDAIDTLDLPARGELIQLLDGVAYEGWLDTIIALGTLKAMPQDLPDTMTAFWIDGGVVQGGAVEERKAA